MKYILTFLCIALLGTFISAQTLAVKTYGNSKDIPIIFLHGGPGYNSVLFEITTAQELANNGFFVISYDRRGEGRNDNLPADFTFDQTFEDLDQIFKSYHLSRASLIGHSFGGVVATRYAIENPEKLHSLILVSTPISMQATLNTIITKSKKIYTDKGDNLNLKYISMLEQMDSTSLEYSSYTFMHAMSNGFYTTKTPDQHAMALYQKFESDSLLREYSSKMGYLAPQKFWENERYTSISLKDDLETLKVRIPVYALYGTDDGLFSIEQIDDARNLLGDSHLEYLKNASHNIFMDRQKEFIRLVKEWTK